ncbi:hypothetical protein [Miltoncostaea marina]|uniref:hypothetical protein n=1 Tax=Miltoncostaea marina TaxID=2843215 RepID=UPI001FE9711E|nr:hypothetical protein [Miltoncostaea marina]
MTARVGQDVLDLLSELRVLEREGARQYAALADEAPAWMRPKLLEYAEQARRGALVIETAMERLGGDPAYVSPAAEAVARLSAETAVLAAGAPVHPPMNRLLWLLGHEDRDLITWQVIDALGHREGGEAGEVLRTAAGAVLTQETAGARGADRNVERREWLRHIVRRVLAAEYGLPDPASREGRRIGRR